MAEMRRKNKPPHPSGTPPRRGINVKVNVKNVAVDVDFKIPRRDGVPPKGAGWWF
jgi:hypothetical protein